MTHECDFVIQLGHDIVTDAQNRSLGLFRHIDDSPFQTVRGAWPLQLRAHWHAPTFTVERGAPHIGVTVDGGARHLVKRINIAVSGTISAAGTARRPAHAPA